MKSNNLHKAKVAKNDEFYTMLTDIEKELIHYKEHFRDKVVLCNCDNPEYSNFWKYFELNFEHLGLKKLISTHYETDKPSYKLEMVGKGNIVKTPLSQNGDFRSPECIELLKEADIVCTNEPFSLAREYIAQLMEYNKKFLIIANKNAITYKEVFPLLKDNKMWLGYNSPSEFKTPDGEITKKLTGLTRWFTNLDIKKRNEGLPLYKHYNEQDYPHYDNYDAINVDKVKDIPCDYYGVMGVPITYLDSHNPDMFEIIGLLHSSTDEQAGITNLRYYNNFREMRQDMTFTGSSGGKANGNPVIQGKPVKGNFLFNEETKEFVHSIYARIVIKRKDNNQ